MQISLKAARVNAGLTQKEASKAIGINVSTMIKWESGQTCPKFSQLTDLCSLYNIPVANIRKEP